ncbi:MAG: M23 family metallopeptidase [Clostridiaceae bacterium]|jgi:murein DD-endopeptidase MepM/ murein hydrolase activator NlpD|nr:M23 family metallopeptidase [Clostridiaceae bacterium]
MKFRREFKNRYIYFVVLLIAALLTAGGVLQYRNYLADKQAQLDFERSMEEYIEESEPSSTAQAIVEDAEESGEEGIGVTSDATEVSNSSSVKIGDNAQGTKEGAGPEKVQGNEGKSTSAIKMEEPTMETMVVPVFGTTYTEFSEDVLVYSKTLDQWGTHEGIDIKAEEGSPVRAAMDGVVDQLVNDPRLGLTIVLNHGGEVYTKYANLSTLDLVAINQSIKKGDVISGVGKTALYEIADDPHLHFEVIKEGKNVDPKKYLPKQSLKK